MGILDGIKKAFSNAVENYKKRQQEIQENKRILRKYSHRQLKNIAREYGISTKGIRFVTKDVKRYNPLTGRKEYVPEIVQGEYELSYEELVDRLAKRLYKDQIEELKRKLGIIEEKGYSETSTKSSARPQKIKETQYQVKEKQGFVFQVLHEIESYIPQRNARKEETYEEGLYQRLALRLNLDYSEIVRQYQNFDIAIPKARIAIEVKHKMNKSDRDRLIGQMFSMSKKGWISIAVIFNTKNKALIYEMVEMLKDSNLREVAVIVDGKLIFSNI